MFVQWGRNIFFPRYSVTDRDLAMEIFALVALGMLIPGAIKQGCVLSQGRGDRMHFAVLCLEAAGIIICALT